MSIFIKTGLWENRKDIGAPKNWLNLTKLIQDTGGGGGAVSLDAVVDVSGVTTNGLSNFSIIKSNPGLISLSANFRKNSMFATDTGGFSLTDSEQRFYNASMLINWHHMMRTTPYFSSLGSYEEGNVNSSNFTHIVSDAQGITQSVGTLLGGIKSAILSTSGFGIKTNTNDLYGYFKSDNLNFNDVTVQFANESGIMLLDTSVQIIDEAEPSKRLRLRAEGDNVIRLRHPDNVTNGIINLSLTNNFTKFGVTAKNNVSGFSFQTTGTINIVDISIPDISFGTLGLFRTAAAPANSSSTGKVGEMKADASWLYVCTATNTWRRVALSTF